MKASENLDAGMKYPKIELARGAVRNADWSLYRVWRPEKAGGSSPTSGKDRRK